MRFGWAALFVSLVLVACRAPTEIDLSVTTDVPCESDGGVVVSTDILTGGDDLFDGGPHKIATSTSCEKRASGQNYLGKLVVTPSGSESAPVDILVVTGVNQGADECVAHGYEAGPTTGCIVERRSWTFVAHDQIAASIFMPEACEKLQCGPGSTCTPLGVGPDAGAQCTPVITCASGVCMDSGVDSGTSADTGADTTTDTGSGGDSSATDGTMIDVSPATYTVGGTVTGLPAGSTVVLQDNGGDNLSVVVNGSFVFPTALASGASYDVTVLTELMAPPGTCTVTGGTGTVGMDNVTDVVVACMAGSFTIGGTVSGLAPGDSVVLGDNGGDPLTLTANGAFTFATSLASGASYSVTVVTQPGGADGGAETCTVGAGTGTVGSGNVTNVTVTCVAETFTVGGTVTGLAPGDTVVLTDNGGDALTLSSNGMFEFAQPVASGGAYGVTVVTQPGGGDGGVAQTCTVGQGMGTVTTSDVTSVVVTCTDEPFLVGGTVAGLAGGATLLLQDNGGDNLFVTTNGSFVFPTPVAPGATFTVTAPGQPISPAQTCTVGGGTGVIGQANVTMVTVTCVTSSLPVGGIVTGLAAGASIVLEDDHGDDLTVSANGPFTFATDLLSGSAYDVTVASEPSGVGCTVSAGLGQVGATAVTSVVVNCGSGVYTVGGTVQGLSPNESVVLLDEGGNALTVSAGASSGSVAFAFPSPVATGTAYAVTVKTNPSSPVPETCLVSSGTGTVGAANVTAPTVTCTPSAFSVGGTVSGLAAGQSVKLLDEGGSALTVATNGSFTFPGYVMTGTAYAITVGGTSGGMPPPVCTVTSGSGTVGASNVTGPSVSCGPAPLYAVGGTVTGLAPGDVVVLEDNGASDLSVTANGSFAFPARVVTGTAYAITVEINPANPTESCVVTAGTGTVGTSDVTAPTVTCTAAMLYAVGGTVTGLLAGDAVVLQDNGGSTLTVGADGAFQFPTFVPAGTPYAITVLTNPTTPTTEACLVTLGTGTVGTASVTAPLVTCSAQPLYTIGGTVSGVMPGQTVVLQDEGTNNLTLGANGAFQFSSPVPTATPYAVTVLTNPTGEGCTITMGSGTVAGANVTSIVVHCVAATTYTVGGTVSGLLANAQVGLQDNGGNGITITANGPFTFPSSFLTGAPYAVTVATNPTSPLEACTVTMGTGTIAMANVTAPVVTCAPRYTVGVALNGLLAGASVTLQNGSNPLTLDSNGTFTFSPPVPSGTPYAITVSSNPLPPNAETCVVMGGTGTVGSANVIAIVSCSPALFTIEVTVTGVVATDMLVLQDNGGDSIPVNSSGTYSFATKLPSGATYDVTAASAFASGCLVTMGSGTVANTNVTSPTVTCGVTTETLTVTVAGLNVGSNGVTLQDNGSNGVNTLVQTTNGTFGFPPGPLAEGTTYDISVVGNPTGQVCTVVSGTGVVGVGASPTVTCGTSPLYSVGGVVNGLPSATDSVYLVDEGDTAHGVNVFGTADFAMAPVFAFPTPVAAGTPYSVVVFSVSDPDLTCSVFGGTGTGFVGTGNVTSIVVNCTP